MIYQCHPCLRWPRENQARREPAGGVGRRTCGFASRRGQCAAVRFGRARRPGCMGGGAGSGPISHHARPRLFRRAQVPTRNASRPVARASARGRAPGADSPNCRSLRRRRCRIMDALLHGAERTQIAGAAANWRLMRSHRRITAQFRVMNSSVFITIRVIAVHAASSVAFASFAFAMSFFASAGFAA
jgi:hypothetical protein